MEIDGKGDMRRQAEWRRIRGVEGSAVRVGLRCNMSAWNPFLVV